MIGRKRRTGRERVRFRCSGLVKHYGLYINEISMSCKDSNLEFISVQASEMYFMGYNSFYAQ